MAWHGTSRPTSYPTICKSSTRQQIPILGIYSSTFLCIKISIKQLLLLQLLLSLPMECPNRLVYTPVTTSHLNLEMFYKCRVWSRQLDHQIQFKKSGYFRHNFFCARLSLRSLDFLNQLILCELHHYEFEKHNSSSSRVM